MYDSKFWKIGSRPREAAKIARTSFPGGRELRKLGIVQFYDTNYNKNAWPIPDRSMLQINRRKTNFSRPKKRYFLSDFENIEKVSLFCGLKICVTSSLAISIWRYYVSFNFLEILIKRKLQKLFSSTWREDYLSLPIRFAVILCDKQ